MSLAAHLAIKTTQAVQKSQALPQSAMNTKQASKQTQQESIARCARGSCEGQAGALQDLLELYACCNQLGFKCMVLLWLSLGVQPSWASGVFARLHTQQPGTSSCRWYLIPVPHHKHQSGTTQLACGMPWVALQPEAGV